MTPEEQAAADEAARIATEAAGSGNDDTAAELERMRVALAKANKSDEARRRKIEAFEADEAARQQATMTETDRLRAELEAAKAATVKADERAKLTLIRAAFVAEAAKAGASYPEDVYRLADTSAVDIADDGAVTGVAEAVKTLVDAGRVPLTGRTPAPRLDGGAGGHERPGGQVKLTPEQIEMARKLNVTPEKYAANLAAMKARQE